MSRVVAPATGDAATKAMPAAADRAAFRTTEAMDVLLSGEG